MAALVFMARTSTPWSLLPVKELGCGSATTCWRRLGEWAKAGVFEQLQAVLLDELGEAGRIDPGRVSVDSFSLRAVKGGPDRRKPGRSGQGRLQLHLAGDAGGLPLSVILSAANANDATMLEAVLDDIPAILMPTGRRRRQGLRPPPLPALPAPPLDRSRIARRMVDSSARPSPLDNRAHRGVAGRLPAATDPL